MAQEEKEVKKIKAKAQATKPVRAKSNIDLLLENSIALQKTLVDLTTGLKELNKKVSSMLELFEAATKAIKEKPQIPITELAEKIELLMKQNKTIAKGLLLLEKAIREEKEAPEAKPLPTI